MKRITMVRYDAFADAPGMGNPCGVVPDASGLTDEEMQTAAREAGYTECAFVCPPTREEANVRLRFFMPGRETALCGHGTVCALTALMARRKPQAPLTVTAETRAGLLSLDYDPANGQVTMQQSPARFEPFDGDVNAVLAAIGLEPSDLDDRWPVLYGSTGSWTLILPVRSLEAFLRMKPRNALFASLLTSHPDASVHPICTDTVRTPSALHGRHFSCTGSGSVEDPVTGTASGVMGAYYLQYMPQLHSQETDSVDILVEQGQDAGWDGLVRVWARRDGDEIRVKIAGCATECETLTMEV